MKRCPWLNLNNPLYVKYHDQEWGQPIYSDRKHFEMLVLESAQAGLSWETVLKKRENYRLAFDYFDFNKVARYSSEKIKTLLKNPKIIRNQLKIKSAVSNARAFIKIRKEFGTFNKYIWRFVDNKPVVSQLLYLKDYPCQTKLSNQISEELKKRGFKFVGPIIIYSYLQAVGLVNDHSVDCFKRPN